MELVKGDLFTFGGSIGHGVNTKGFMDSGIAVTFKNKFPEMFKEYVSQCKSGILTPGGVYIYTNGENYIYNLASQEKPGANAQLKYLSSAGAKALNHAESRGIETIALPKIGSGVGGLKWNDVERVLLQVERNRSSYFTIYEL